MKVAVIGAGIWGLSTAYHLQRLGYKTSLWDPWGPGNPQAGSGGASRIIRLGYGADELYIDMTARAFHWWDTVINQQDRSLYIDTGLLWMFPDEDARYITDAMGRMHQLGYHVEAWDAARVKSKWPQIAIDGLTKIFYEEKAGILMASRCCQQLFRLYLDKGGTYHQAAIERDPGQVGVQSLLWQDRPLDAELVIVAAGPWNRSLLPEVLFDVTYISRQEVFFFAPPATMSQQFQATTMPVWLEYDPESPLYYGMPDHANLGFKVAYDDRATPFNPDKDDRMPSREVLSGVRSFLHRRFPSIAEQPMIAGKVCQYENSLDGHFIIDRHPQDDRLIFLAGSSGHGFKMGPALGAMVAETLKADRQFPEMFRLERFRSDLTRRSQFVK